MLRIIYYDPQPVKNGHAEDHEKRAATRNQGKKILLPYKKDTEGKKYLKTDRKRNTAAIITPLL